LHPLRGPHPHLQSRKDTGLTNLSLHGYAQNQLWLAVVSLAVELTAWLQMLAFTDQPARRCEPKRLRLRMFTITGRLVRHPAQANTSDPSKIEVRPPSRGQASARCCVPTT